jgi:glycosyltransferase involved in cell wall biosynthesis
VTSVTILTSVHRPFDQRIFYRQARTLASAGYSVTLIAPADFEHRIVDGVRVLGIPRPRNRLARVLTWFRLARAVVRNRPDVVHFHDPELLLVAATLKGTVGRRISFIYDVHEYFVDSVREKTWLPPRIRPLAAKIAGWLEQFLARCVSGVICAIEDQLTLYTRLKCPKTAIHNYPAVSDFSDAQWPTEYGEGQFRLVYIGSLFERRGVWTMMEAFRNVVQSVPQAHLFLGGGYEDPAFEQRVERFVAENDLPVTFLGWVPFERVKDYLTHAHCAWMPGRMTAQFSNRALSTKILEAMICSTPIVSADLPHRREFIEPPNAGILVSPEDAAEHVAAVEWLYQHPEQREAMGTQGRTWVLERYTWEREGPILLTFYEQLLDRQGLR